MLCCRQKGLIPIRRQKIVNMSPICPTTTRTTSPRIWDTRQTNRGRESWRPSYGHRLCSAVHAKHTKGSAGTDPRTQKATILLMDRRKSKIPKRKTETERKRGMWNVVSTGRVGGPESPAISEKGRCRCGASAAERTVARMRTKLREKSTMTLMADAKGLNGASP